MSRSDVSTKKVVRARSADTEHGVEHKVARSDTVSAIYTRARFLL